VQPDDACPPRRFQAMRVLKYEAAPGWPCTAGWGSKRFLFQLQDDLPAEFDRAVMIDHE